MNIQTLTLGPLATNCYLVRADESSRAVIIDIRRTLGRKQEELKDKLFVELRDMLANYLETQDYQKLLERQVQHAVEFAGTDQVIIYLDPVDEDKALCIKDISLILYRKMRL